MRQRFNDLADQANEGYSAAREGATRGMRSAYSTAREYPGTIAAIVVGLGVTAFLLWAGRRLAEPAIHGHRLHARRLHPGARGLRLRARSDPRPHGALQGAGAGDRGVISASIALERSA